jgi:hypothetical protein
VVAVVAVVVVVVVSVPEKLLEPLLGSQRNPEEVCA